MLHLGLEDRFRQVALRFVTVGPLRLVGNRSLAGQLLQQAPQLRRLLDRGAETFEGVFAVDHHRTSLKATIQAVITESDPVAAALVLQELDGRLGVLSGVRGLFDYLATAPMELEGPRDWTAATFVGRRSINRASHGRFCVPCLRA